MPTIRPARFDDCLEATTLLRRLGLELPAEREQVFAHWARLWRDNPALAPSAEKPELGWVLEEGRRIVGFFASVLQQYHWGERPLLVSLASQWGVEREFRNHTPKLAEAYFSQTTVDLLLVTTAIKPTGRIFNRNGGISIPQPSLDRVAMWVLDYASFLTAAARKKGIAFARAAALAAPLAAAADMLRPKPRRSGGVGVMAGIDGIGPAFDRLWQTKLTETPRLLSCRNAAALRWHYAPHASRGDLHILTLERDGRLRGYAVLIRADAPAIGLKRAKLADALVLEDEPKAFETLLAEAWQLARRLGFHVLEVHRLPAPLQTVLTTLRPLRRQLPAWPGHYKLVNSEFATALARPEVWAITDYDGDTTLF